MTWLPAALAALAAALVVDAGSQGPGALRRVGRRVGASPTGVVRLAPVLGRPVVLVGLAVPPAVLVGGPVAGLLAPVVVLVGRATVTGRAAAVAAARDRLRAIEAVQALAAELRAGRSPGAALATAAEAATGDVGTALRRAAQAAAVGGDVPAALLSSDASPLLRSLAVCWRVCAEAGNGLAAAVERLGDGLAAAEDQRRALEAELAGPRATAGLLAVLPVGGVALAASLGADPLQVLLHTPVGAVCLVAGVVLDLLGLAWTRALVRRAMTA